MTRKPHKTPPAQPYQYNELPRDGSFRYIVLHRGTGNEPLKCSLQTAPLAKTSFEAISYVWGKSKKNKKIICDGRVIRITKSLSNVLRRLRLPHKRRKLWADGICINQDDLEEKGHQVAIMGDIYRSAKCVLIYIGPEDYGDGPLVCSLLDDVNRMFDETCKDINMARDAFPWPKDDDALLSDSRWNSLNNLFRHKWFERGWVVREAASARYGLVIWHNSEFNWKKLMRVNIWLVMRGERIKTKFEIKARTVWSHSEAFKQKDEAFIATLCKAHQWRSPSLLTQLSAGKALKLSDSRDRIYAFMEFSGGIEGVVTITPNYHEHALDVYHQFAVTYIQQTKDVQMLEYVCHHPHANFLGIPSWVPRWDNRRWSIPRRGTSRGVTTTPSDGSYWNAMIYDDHDILSVRGVVLDSVLWVSDIFKGEEWDMSDTLNEVWDSISQTLNTSPYGTSHGFDAFFDCLTCTSYYGRWSDWRRTRATYITYRKTLLPLYGGSASGDPVHDDDLGFDAEEIWDHIKGNITDRRFIFTRRGYWGLAPDVTKEDDSCAIIFGCEMPCILRQTDREQHYEYLGASWILGSHTNEGDDDDVVFYSHLGGERSKEWEDWGVEEQDIHLV